MKNIRKYLIMAGILMVITLSTMAQFVPHYQWTLLDKKLMDLIIGESSGETVLAHDIEMGGYTRDRLSKEY
jgi:hypothetical protein